MDVRFLQACLVIPLGLGFFWYRGDIDTEAVIVSSVLIMIALLGVIGAVAGGELAAIRRIIYDRLTPDSKKVETE